MLLNLPTWPGCGGRLQGVGGVRASSGWGADGAALQPPGKLPQPAGVAARLESELPNGSPRTPTAPHGRRTAKATEAHMMADRGRPQAPPVHEQAGGYGPAISTD